jgi:copper chaperone CopZ
MNSDDRTTLIMIVCVLLFAGALLLFGQPCNAKANSLVLLRTDGMTCGSCVQKITLALNSHPGVADVTVDVPAGLVEIQFDSSKTTPNALAANVRTVGFPATVAHVQPLGNANRPAPVAGGCNSGGCGNCNKR